VQTGDTLYSIALRFGISLTSLTETNGITDPNQLFPGQELIIPGLEGVSGLLTTETLGFGDSLAGMATRTNIPYETLVRINRITSPSEVYAGMNIILPQLEGETALNKQIAIRSGQTLLEASILQDSSPWTISLLNNLPNQATILPGDRLYINISSVEGNSIGIYPYIENIKVDPLPLVQGHMAELSVNTYEDATLSGSLTDHELVFFPNGDKSYVALQGIHAMLDPGLYPISIAVQLADGSTFSYQQQVYIESGNFPKDPPLTVDPTTLDPAVTQPEEEQVVGVISRITSTRQWSDIFTLPVGTPYCIKSWFGDRRSYNGSEYSYFHAGLDYGVCSVDKPFAILAPAPGTVVFTGQLTVRGNATIIDHGWGIFTGYWHQKGILVNVGDPVTAGQEIGLIGATGRANGPHLHWEVWVNGVQVDPQDWLDRQYP
ncbi:MAG: LysM peptidoglycan-binding domain-containing protein, partial [Anaerolineaceae bacterium]